MSPAWTCFGRQLADPPEPPARGDHAWLFMAGTVSTTRIVGRATATVGGRAVPVVSCVVGGRVTFVPADRVLAIPTPDPYRMPTESLS